jgi:mutator protein MutT
MACAVVEQRREGIREILIGKIPAAPYEGKWTFPGGPVEKGESPEAGLRRALDSLLGLKPIVHVGQPPFDKVWDGVTLRWRFFFCEAQSDAIHNHHYQEIRWVSVGSLREYEFDPAAQQVVDWMLESPD